MALGDNFLSMIVPEIEASQAFKDNGKIVIWNDETEGDEGAGSTAGFTSTEIIISPLAKGNAYTNDISTRTPPTWSPCRTYSESKPTGPISAAPGARTDSSDLFKPGAIPSTVPEPSTWAMLLLGFAGLAGAGAYRRKLGGAVKPAVAC